ncbi:MAG TPA: TolC family protein [Balneolales bacterium]|nr:TolC family protein [Balneolales bacterium]
MYKAFIACALALCFTFSAQAQAQNSSQTGRTITLQNAINIALKNNYQIKIAENNVSQASAGYLNAKANFLPDVNASMRGGQQMGQQFNNVTISFENQTVKSASGSISAGITLFSGWQNIYDLHRADQNKLSQKEQEVRTKENVIFGTASAYLQVLLDQQLLEIAKENLASSQKQLDQIKAQVEVGAKPVADQYNQEATVANNELTLTQNQNTLSNDKQKLVNQLQIDPMKSYHFVSPKLDTTDIAVNKYNINKLVREALENRSDIKSQKYAIQAAYNSLKMSESSLFPTITFNASLSGSYNDKFINPTSRGTANPEVMPFGRQFFNKNVNKYFGFNISIPLFNRYNSRYNIESSKIQYKNAKLNLENTRLQTIQDIRQAYNDYYNYEQQLKSTNKALQAAKRAYETQQERYKVGAGTLIELTQANAQYVQASSQHVQALYRLIFQEQLINYYTGQLSPNMKFKALKF